MSNAPLGPLVPAKATKFAEAYERNMLIMHERGKYQWPLADLPNVVRKMMVSFALGGYSKDGPAIKATCKELDIPYTHRGIDYYLRSE